MAYLLLGDDPTAVGEARCYIGEADEIRTRLKEQASNRGKDFWNRVVIITSKDANLTKAHGRYLEARLISLAVTAGRSHVENGTNPPTPSLPASGNWAESVLPRSEHPVPGTFHCFALSLFVLIQTVSGMYPLVLKRVRQSA